MSRHRHKNRHAAPIPGITGQIEHAEHTPTYNLDTQIAKARREMGEARWNQLNEEWQA